MKAVTRRNGKSTKSKTSTAGKARWLPTDNTRATTFADRRALANKQQCRKKVSYISDNP